MHKKFTGLYALALLPAMLGAGEKPWRSGKVLDSASAKVYIAETDQAWLRTTTIRDTQLLIVDGEYAWLIEDTRRTQGFALGEHAASRAIGIALANRHRGCRFVVGDPVRFWQDKNVLHVIDADEKECRTEVLRQERVPK